MESYPKTSIALGIVGAYYISKYIDISYTIFEVYEIENILIILIAAVLSGIAYFIIPRVIIIYKILKNIFSN